LEKVEAIDLLALQEYVEKRSHDRGLGGSLSPVTIRKEITTLRAVFNWAKHAKLVQGEIPSRGLKFPKGKEKPPYTSFKQVLKRSKVASDDEASELWESVFLTLEELDELLEYVERVANHPHIYPMFVFCSHTGARRSEIARVRVTDIDFADGFVTLRERKKSRDTKTTRRVPMFGLLRQVMREWVKGRRGPLFSIGDQPFTAKAMHRCFEYTLAESKWQDLWGWHVFRHSFISSFRRPIIVRASSG
jgi:integrase